MNLLTDLLINYWAFKILISPARYKKNAPMAEEGDSNNNILQFVSVQKKKGQPKEKRYPFPISCVMQHMCGIFFKQKVTFLGNSCQYDYLKGKSVTP